MRRFVRVSAILALTVCLMAFAAARTAQADEVQIRHGGLRLNGEARLAPGKSLKDGAVLMVHGYTGHHRLEVIQALQGVLSERGLSSVAITLGLRVDARRGMFDCALPHRHLRSDALDEIGAWLEWLGRQGAGKIALFGHSAGGQQAAWFAAERGHKALVAAVLLAPVPLLPEPIAQGYARLYGKPLAGALDQAEAALARDPGAMLKNTDFLYCRGATVAAAAFVDYYRDVPARRLPALLARITVPTLVIVGSKDEIVPELPAAIRPQVDGKRVRTHEVDQADHFFRDLFADEVADKIAEFLRD